MNEQINFNKKSQAAIFIIAGIIIALGSILFFYSAQSGKETLQSEIKIVQEQVPLEFDPVRKYANDCAYSVSVEGLKIIGKQGGYASFTDKALNKEQFSLSSNPTESEAVSFAKDSDLKIPYWWYLKSSNKCVSDCEFSAKKPDLRQTDNSIEKQLERYINLKFKDCLNNFEPFAEQGYKVSEKGKVQSDATIGSEDISVLIQYPIAAEKQGAKSDITQFSANVPLNLERLYKLAANITNLEIKHHYIEKHVLNLIVAFSGINKDKLPPMSDMTFNFGSSTSWQKTEVKNRVTGLLTSYVPLFQADETANYERNVFDTELKQRLYDSTIIPVGKDTFKDLSASFTYLDFWPAYFDLNCKGEICKPSSGSSLIPIIGLQTYRFSYDLSFPVLVELQDPGALNGQGYNFNFFLEGNIRNNKYLDVDYSLIEVKPETERSQLCDIRTSGNVAVKVLDAVAKKPIEGAQVLYSLTGESCFIGATEQDGTLNEKFPLGIGGYVNVISDGYVGKAVEFDPELSKDTTLKIELQPVYTKEIVVMKKDVIKTISGWQFDDAPKELGEKESATVTLTRAGDGSELEFSSAAGYTGQQKEKSELELAPGEYTADINLLLNDKVVIPERKKKVCSFLGLKCEEFTIPKVDFGEGASPGYEAFPAGGLKMKVTISPDDLKNSRKIVLYAVNIALADVPEQDRVVEDLEQMSRIEYYSSTYWQQLQPEFG